MNRAHIASAYYRFSRLPMPPDFLTGAEQRKLRVYQACKAEQIERIADRLKFDWEEINHPAGIPWGEWKVYIKLIQKWLVPTKLVKFQKLKLQGTLNDGSRIYAQIRYDDECGNGHNTFSITAEIPEQGMFGCCHDEFAEAFPEYAHLLKWHLCSADGPLHYIANTMYHARQNGPTHGWLYEREGKLAGGLKMGQRCIAYTEIYKAEEAIALNPDRDLFLKIDDRTEKAADLEAARQCAIAPDATAEQLRDPEWLLGRLITLLGEFRCDIESLGFTF